MRIDYIAQPDNPLGTVLSNMLDAQPPASSIVFVSAFVSVQAVMRVKRQILLLKEYGSNIRFVLGIDLGGTSREVLAELLEWDIDVRIVKHRIPRHTFHPKLYLFEWTDRATVIIGSNNMTEGGFFGNYECAARITYLLPKETKAFDTARSQLDRFLQPTGSTVYQLTKKLLAELLDRGVIPTEAEVRKALDTTAKSEASPKREGQLIFGQEEFAASPPLPPELIARLVKDVRTRRTAAKKEAAATLPVDDQTRDLILPAAFYMTLPTLQGDNIPGEGRIPLEAIELAKEFWGWPDEYTREVSTRGRSSRVYWNWRPQWRVWSVEAPDAITTQEVRMYMYENSSDFRFYVRPLVNASGNLGDVVRIRRIAEPDAEYECVLARQQTAEYKEWIKACTQPVRSSTRCFGYA